MPGRQRPLSGQTSPVLALVPIGLRFTIAFIETSSELVDDLLRPPSPPRITPVGDRCHRSLTPGGEGTISIPSLPQILRLRYETRTPGHRSAADLVARAPTAWPRTASSMWTVDLVQYATAISTDPRSPFQLRETGGKSSEKRTFTKNTYALTKVKRKVRYSGTTTIGIAVREWPRHDWAKN